MPQWSPALIGRESEPAEAGDRVGQGGRNGALPLSAGRAVTTDRPTERSTNAAMEPCPYRQGEAELQAIDAGLPHAAMEPCPYRQGEGTGRPPEDQRVAGRNGALPLSAGRGRDGTGRGSVYAAMEPCPYRQGETIRR